MRQINRFLIYHTLQRNKIIPWDREASRFAFINGPGFQWWGCHGGEIERWEAEIWSGSQRTYRLSKGFLSSRKDSYGMKCNMNHYHPILSLGVLVPYSIVLMSYHHYILVIAFVTIIIVATLIILPYSSSYDEVLVMVWQWQTVPWGFLKMHTCIHWQSIVSSINHQESWISQLPRDWVVHGSSVFLNLCRTNCEGQRKGTFANGFQQLNCEEVCSPALPQVVEISPALSNESPLVHQTRSVPVPVLLPRTQDDMLTFLLNCSTVCTPTDWPQVLEPRWQQPKKPSKKLSFQRP